MKHTENLRFIFLFALLLTPQVLRAESWPTLEKFASDCVLIVKARQVGAFSAQENSGLWFEVLETWKGHYDPKAFASKMVSLEGYFRASQGEHGVRVAAEQEIVFFFTRHNQPKDKLARHNTAFPIKDGKVVYAGTGEWGEPRVFTTTEFKRAIAAAPAHDPKGKK